MALSIKALEKLRMLRRDAAVLAAAEQSYAKATAPSHVDKHGFKFSTNDRCSTFRTQVSLETYTGTYGNSSVGTFLSLVSDKSDVADVFIRALNHHRSEILQTMARIMNDDADKLKGEAEREIEALRELIERPLAEEEAA